MIKFWDIEFDNENPFFDEDFVEGLLKLGFQKKTGLVESSGLKWDGQWNGAIF